MKKICTSFYVSFLLALFLSTRVPTAALAQIPTSNLKVHLNAGSGVNLTDDRVDSWNDLSGLGNHGQVEQSSTRPYLVNNVINGQPAVYFNGTNHYIYLPFTSTLGIQDNDYEVFIVAKTEESNSTTQYIIAGGINELELSLNESTNDWGLLFKQNSSYNVHSGSLGSISNTQPFIANVSATASEAALEIGGYSYSVSAGNYQTSFAGNILLGIRSGGSSPFKGYIAEVLIYNTKLSTQAHDSVKSYLYGKYYQPTVQSTNIVFSEQSNTSVKLSLTSGNGTKRIILGKENSAVDALPVNLTEYIGNQSFYEAQTLGTGNRIVYVGEDTTVTVYGLFIGKIMHFAAFEYNSEFELETYLTSNPPVNSIAFSNPFAGGTGSEEDPFQIATPDQLNDIRVAIGSYFVLNNDIDLNVSPYNTGEGWNPIPYFYGNLNGNGFAIQNLRIARAANNQGFIKELYGTITDVQFSDIQFTMGDNIDGVGSVASDLRGGTLDGIVVNGSITAGNTYAYSLGGLVGEIAHGTVTNSIVNVDINFIGTGSVDFSGAFGGAFGEISGTVLIDNVISYGDVIVTNGGVNSEPIGGFAGLVYGSNVTITNSASYGNVVGDISLGGFVGFTYSGLTISNSFSTGNVTSRTIGQDIGGFVGYLYNSSISNSYSTGNVIIETAGDRVGGFVGNSNGGTISNSFVLGSLSNATNVGGFIGTNTGTVTHSFWNTLISGQAASAAGTSKSLTELSQAATFSNWDLENIWQITEGASMPWLRTNPSSYRIGIPTLTGTEGWRLLASPVADSSYSSLFRGLWTQGFTGASTTNGSSNVFTWALDGNSDASSNWTALANGSVPFENGKGALVYVFSDDDGTGNENNAGFPKTLSADGFTVSADLNVSSLLNPNTNGWSLMGNPFITNLDWDLITSSNLSGSVYVWDNNSSSWKTWNGTIGSLSNGLIGPFNGFFVETVGESPTLTLPTAAKAGGNTTFLGKENAEEKPMAFSVKLTAANGLSNQAWVQFSADGLTGKDRQDAYALQPFSAKYVQVGTLLNNGKSLDINHLPLDFSRVELRLALKSTEMGTHKISVDISGLPTDWKISILDSQTGIEYDATREIAFFNETPALKATVDVTKRPEIHVVSVAETRFVLRIVRGTSTASEALEKNYTLALHQNFPNPFNPSTNLSFSLSKPGFVKISVFDLMGRLVAEPISNMMNAGEYKQTFNASKLASGVYFYTMSVDGNAVKTLKMTLLK